MGIVRRVGARRKGASGPARSLSFHVARRRTSEEDEWSPDDDRDSDLSRGDAAFGDDDEHDAHDRARFESETAFCPECGAEIYDAADVCPKCFTWIDGDTLRRPSSQRRRTFRHAVVWILIGTFLAGAGALSLLRVL